MIKDPYFQFPLCALAFGGTVDVRLNVILDYSLVEAGSRLLRKLPAEQQREFLSQMREERRLPKDFKENIWSHCAAVRGAHIIGVTYSSIAFIVEHHSRLQKFVSEFEARHGTDARVRIKKDWLFAARDHSGLTYREFAVLCGIYSVIGDKELAQVTRERIRRCALGYRTAAIMRAELPSRADKAQPLTERQLRDTIAQLHRNKFFARSTYARRITYYSIRLDNEAIRKKILERRTYPGFFHDSQAAQDKALTAAINQRRREAFQTAAKAPSASPRFSITLPG